MVCSDGIQAVPRNRKLSEYRGTKLEANCRNFVPKHFVEEKTPHIVEQKQKQTFGILFRSILRKKGSSQFFLLKLLL
jgi:hypothetical protein